MARPVTMFTGQWADLSVAELARKFSEFGYDGLELACWGDHFEVDKALDDSEYCARKRELLDEHKKLFGIQALRETGKAGQIGKDQGDVAALSGGFPFVFFAAMMVVQFFVVLFFYPETKGLSLEEMQKMMGIT